MCVYRKMCVACPHNLLREVPPRGSLHSLLADPAPSGEEVMQGDRQGACHAQQISIARADCLLSWQAAVCLAMRADRLARSVIWVLGLSGQHVPHSACTKQGPWLETEGGEVAHLDRHGPWSAVQPAVYMQWPLVLQARINVSVCSGLQPCTSPVHTSTGWAATMYIPCTYLNRVGCTMQNSGSLTEASIISVCIALLERPTRHLLHLRRHGEVPGLRSDHLLWPFPPMCHKCVKSSPPQF